MNIIFSVDLSFRMGIQLRFTKKNSSTSMVEYGQRWLLVEDNGSLPWRPSHYKKNSKELEMWSRIVGKWVDLVCLSLLYIIGN